MTASDWMLTAGLGALLLMGMPFAFALGVTVLVALWLSDIKTMVVVQHMIAGLSIYTLLAVPCFILAGDLMHSGGLSRRLIAFVMIGVRRVRGGLGMVAVMSATLFGAMSGSAPATTAAIGRIMIPEMVQRGYRRSFSSALASAYGPIGILIPPSIPIVIWGVISNQSITRLFLAGVIPGILLCLVLMVCCYVYAVWKKIEVVEEPQADKGFAHGFNQAKWALLAPLIILGGIYGGIFTPTEAGAVGVLYGLIVGLWIHKEITWQDLPGVLMRSLRTSAMVILIVGMSTAFGWIIVLDQLPERLANAILSLSDNKIVLLLLINVILLLIGAVMDTIAAMIILSGLLIHIGNLLGMDPLHFGTIVVMNLAIGMATPPFGYTLFTAAACGEESVDRIIPPLIPLVACQIVILLVVTFVPEIATALPSLL